MHRIFYCFKLFSLQPTSKRHSQWIWVVGGVRDHRDTTCHRFTTSFWPDRKLLSVKPECSVAYFILHSAWCLDLRKHLLSLSSVIYGRDTLKLLCIDIEYCAILPGLSYVLFGVTKTTLICTYLPPLNYLFSSSTWFLFLFFSCHALRTSLLMWQSLISVLFLPLLIQALFWISTKFLF